MKRRRMAAAGVLLVALAFSSVTGGRAGAADPELGAYLAGECVTCHHKRGADHGIPPITGWEEAAFVAVLKAYKAKELENPVMRLIAGRLNDEDMAALAAHFGSLPGE